MAEFVRVCPRCRQVNPEYQNVCTACNQFIGMEPTVPSSSAPAAQTAGGPEKSTPVQATRRFVPANDSFYLQLPGSDLVLTVRSGAVLGQAHPSNDAALQIPEEIEGCEFVHRRHCRFELRERSWMVTALDQKELDSDFTNPTYVNESLVTAGSSRTLNNGDRLRLSGITLLVKII